MIGNDIVDLHLAKVQSNWQRPQFLDKIFTIGELNFIQRSKNPEIEVWKLWSRKEAAYKIYNRETGIRGYFPWKLECSVPQYCGTNARDSVSINNSIYYTKTIYTEEFVYTIAAKAIVLFDKIIQLSASEKIIKINDLPFLENASSPVSITHHGRFERKIALLDS